MPNSRRSVVRDGHDSVKKRRSVEPNSERRRELLFYCKNPRMAMQGAAQSRFRCDSGEDTTAFATGVINPLKGLLPRTFREWVVKIARFLHWHSFCAQNWEEHVRVASD